MKWISAQNLIGGMAIGFEQEFGKPYAIVTTGAKNDELYIDYCNNTRNLNIPVQNGLEYNPDYEGADVFAMTPVCAGLSMLNTSTKGLRKRGDPDNIQNQNMYNLLEFALIHHPKVVAFENAPALYTNSGAAVANRLKEISSKHGYSMALYQTNTIFHGIPQNRARTFAVFYSGKPCFFKYEHKDRKDFKDFINDVSPDLPNYIDDEWCTDLNEIQVDFLRKEWNVENLYDGLSKYYEDTQSKKNATLRINQLCNAVYGEKFKAYLDTLDQDSKQTKHARHSLEHFKEKASMGKGVFDESMMLIHDHANAIMYKNIRMLHPDGQRILNMRELLRLMGFPDDFICKGRYVWMVGQNVPVCTANYIARNVHNYLKGELNLANEDFIKQSNTHQRIDVGTVAEAW